METLWAEKKVRKLMCEIRPALVIHNSRDLSNCILRMEAFEITRAEHPSKCFIWVCEYVSLFTETSERI